MTNYIEYLNLPTKIGIVIVAVILVIQIIGEILEFKGKVVPEFMKIRKFFARRKQEREILRQVPEVIKDVKETLRDFNEHYSADNIQKRDDWMTAVNKKLAQDEQWIRELSQKLDKNNADTLALLIDSKRTQIIQFATLVADGKTPVTREQFNRIFKLYEDYEDIIKKNGMTNGEVDISYRIIKESYETHMKNHTFLENIRGYDTN